LVAETSACWRIHALMASSLIISTAWFLICVSSSTFHLVNIHNFLSYGLVFGVNFTLSISAGGSIMLTELSAYTLMDQVLIFSRSNHADITHSTSRTILSWNNAFSILDTIDMEEIIQLLCCFSHSTILVIVICADSRIFTDLSCDTTDIVVDEITFCVWRFCTKRYKTYPIKSKRTIQNKYLIIVFIEKVS